MIEEIESRLKLLRELDHSFKIFGASTHKYELNSVLSLEKVKEFELANSCILPEEYKQFITQLGNGGAGPSYGLFPLGYMDDGFEISKWTLDFVNTSKAFTFTGAFNDTSILARGAPDEGDFYSKDEYESAYDEWADKNYEELQMEYWATHALNGAIPICHHGCAYRSWLVVYEGKEFGNIWQDDTPDEGGVYPAQSVNSNRITFGEWYIDWLDKSVKELRNS